MYNVPKRHVKAKVKIQLVGSKFLDNDLNMSIIKHMIPTHKTIDAPFNCYFGVFLNLSCSLPCEYCVQRITLPGVPIARYPIVPGKFWVEALNSIAGRKKNRFLRSPKRKKIAIMGGEPSLHPDFAYILNNLDNDWRITVTSNFTSPFFDKDMKNLKSIRRRRNLKFNASYHFMYTPIEYFMENVRRAKKSGHAIDVIFIVAHPAHINEVVEHRQKLLKLHPKVRLQRFFGRYNGKLYPYEDERDLLCEHEDGIRDYEAYREGFNQKSRQDMYCKMNKILFAPNGDLYNCHYKFYTAHKDKLGNIFDKDARITMPEDYFLCRDYGFCNPCDANSHPFRKLNGEEFNIGRKPLK